MKQPDIDSILQQSDKAELISFIKKLHEQSKSLKAFRNMLSAAGL